MKTSKSSDQKLQRLTISAVLAALSIVLMVTIRFSIFPSAPFYEMEFADVPILVCSTLFGPIYGLATLFVVCLIQALTVSASSGIIGFLMHFLSSGLMILTIYLLRKKFSGLKGVLVSSLCGVIVVVIVMIPMNIWLASAFMHMDAISFIKGFLGVCVAFNFIKAGANVLIYNLIAPTLLKEYEKISRK
ncbi:MAG: ECF transporter S component [Ruminococcaceae bacterium]|nr:ECF transporter S component [Oscillospiraceae bacterium]